MPENSIVWTDGEDPDMIRAIENAQITFPEFARQAELENFRIVPGFVQIAVKAFFPDPARPTKGEHMFVTDVHTDGNTITGILASDPNDPRLGVVEGQEVKFPVSRLSDWFLVTDRMGLGGFTIDVLKRQMPLSQLKAYQNQPPLSWYKHRGEADGMAELNAVPVCTKCGVRDLIAESYRGGVCGLCQEGGVRCACPDCGAPLIRYPDAPRECHHCLRTKEARKGK